VRKNGNPSSEARILRHRAEHHLTQDKAKTEPYPATAEEIQRLYHELQVHQIELELQNEDLQHTKAETDNALARFTGLFDFAPVGYITLDHKGTILAVNFAGAALLGDVRSQLIGRPFKYFLSNDSLRFFGFLDKAFADQEKKTGEFTLKSAEETPLFVRIEAQVPSPGDDECHLAIIDITELRQKDFLLIAQNRLAAMGEMIDNIAHQWRTPLNTLGLSIQQLLLSREHGELSREFLEESVGKSMELINHMSQTVDDFRNFFNPDKKKVDFKVHDIVVKALSLLERHSTSQKVAINVIENNGSHITGYPNEFLQAVFNILVNAVDALTERKTLDPKITVTIGVEEKKAVVAIADNAGGIPEEIINRIFAPHFTTKGPAKGTGIGLYMSKAIIEKNIGGTLTVRNIPGGVEFRIKI